MYYTPGHFFVKSATGCLVHHYSYPSAQFVENYTLDQFDGNYTLEKYTGFILCFHMGYQSIFPHTDFITWCEQASSAAQACKE